MVKNPLVTVIVVNYNSRKKWDIVEQSIRGILSLTYRPLEVIFVDNGSTDGSFELLNGVVNKVLKHVDEDLMVKVIRLSKNYGFAVANIIAYKLRDANSKYVALINNDLVPEPNSLEKLVKVLEDNPKIAGVQGVILSWDGAYVDTYGCLGTDHGNLYGVGHTLLPNIIVRPILVTYADGAFSMYRTDAIEKCGGLFLPYFFMWGDDYELGVRLWRCGYILVAVPIIVGRHYRGLTVGHKQMPYMYEYWSWLTNIAVMVVLYGHPWILQLLKRIPTILAAIIEKRSKAITRALIDGLKIGIKLRRLVLRHRSWLKMPKEPRLRVNIFWELALLTRLRLRLGKFKAMGKYHAVIARCLGKVYASIKHCQRNT